MQSLPTPAFVLEEEKLIRNLSILKEVQDQSGASVLAALKAFSMYEVFPVIKKYVSGSAVSSLNESKLVNEYWGEKSFTYAPAYKEDEIDELLDNSSHIIFNSQSQYQLFRQKAIKKGVSIGLRINPEYSEVETDLYNPAGPFSRLGIKLSELKDIPEYVEGIHLHALCENEADVLLRLFDSIEHKIAPFLKSIKWINFGGGHLITKENYDRKSLIKFLKRIKEKYQIEVYIEPGSAVAWDTGYLQSTILDILPHKELSGGIAIIDASFTAHMPDCLEMPYKPKIEHENTGGSFEYIIGGMSCLAGDQINGFHFNEPLKIGDKVNFLDMMHYTMVKTSHFNGVAHPSICMKKANGKISILKEVGYEAYKSSL